MELAEIRRKLEEIGRFSHTTQKFQDDLIDFVVQNHDRGGSLIEVGCFHGGLTVQLAHVARPYGLHLDVIDISRQYLDVARDTVSTFGYGDRVAFHKTTLTQFLAERDGPAPLLVFIDGDHRYDGVVADIRAVMGMPERPYACAFHDFSLRYADGPLTNVRVDRAILDEFGPEAPLHRIGETAGDGQLRTVPGADRHYHEPGQPEGVLIVLEELNGSPR